MSMSPEYYESLEQPLAIILDHQKSLRVIEIGFAVNSVKYGSHKLSLVVRFSSCDFISILESEADRFYIPYRRYTANSSDPMNSRKPGVNWDELRAKLSAFDIPIYPYEFCTIGDMIGSGAAMAVFE